jgi:transketolase
LTALSEIAQHDNNVLFCIADNGTGYDALFRHDCPEQFIDFGISEQNMVAAAAGMASCGKIPFIYTNGAFLAYRALEFIRDDVCFQNQNVKIIANGSGLSIPMLGPTHHATEDISILRALPNLTIFSPASPLEVKYVIKSAYKIHGPVYIRLGMNGEPEIYHQEYSFNPGKAVVVQEGKDIALFTTGSIITEALRVSEMLKANGIESEVVNIHTLKPFDSAFVANIVKKIKHIISIEEHSIYGGLGSMIAEVLAEHEIPASMKRIGLDGVLASGYGNLEEVRKANGLDAVSLYNKIESFLKVING